MTKYERAAQLWPLLVLAATHRQVLTYDIVSKLTGVPRPAIGGFLDPIQQYCQVKKIPPLTVLVVSEKSGIPGEGFIAAQDVPKAQTEVFSFDWLGWGCPTVEKLSSPTPD